MFGLIGKHRSYKAVFASAVLVIAGLGIWSAMPATAQDPGPRPGQPARGQGGLSLEGSMKLMERSYKAIARSIDDPAKDEQTLKAIAGFQSGAAASKSFVPHQIEELPEADRAKATAEYRAMLRDVLKTSIELEDAIVAGNRDAAKAALEKLHEMEEKGHHALKVGEHDHDH